MKKVVRRVNSLSLMIIICIPCIVYSYTFKDEVSEQSAKITRREIYDLYNMHKYMMNEYEDEDNAQFGVLGYNGVCSIVTVNGKSMPLDDYVAGVVKAESAPGNIESYKAQAIAARSFLLHNEKDNPSCSVGSGQDYQVYTEDNDSNSIYHRAAKETSMMVVERNGEIALTQYQSYPAREWCTEDSSGWHVKFQRFAGDESTKWVWDGPPKKEVFAVTS